MIQSPHIANSVPWKHDKYTNEETSKVCECSALFRTMFEHNHIIHTEYLPASRANYLFRDNCSFH